MTDDSHLEMEIAATIRKVIRAVDLHSHHLAESHGMTGPQLATLQQAARLGSASVGALAAAVHLSQPTVTGILARLSRQGLIERAPDARDRRAVRIRVTPAGHEMLQRAPSPLSEHFRQGLQQLAPWERTMILCALQRVADLMTDGAEPEAERSEDHGKMATAVDVLSTSSAAPT